jgi:K+-transporting ATPase ATPase B chain
MALTKRPLFDPPIVKRAVRDAFAKTVNLGHMVRNPVMFVVLIGSVLTTVVLLRDLAQGRGGIGFTLQITVWLWFTVVFANFAEAMAEGRGKAQAETLRRSRTETTAKRLRNAKDRTKVESVPGAALRKGDVVLCTPGDMIPGDGEVIEGVASVDESAITGESAPVIRESGGDRSAVTGGTKVLSDFLVVRITANPGETFLDRMITLVEGAIRAVLRWFGVDPDPRLAPRVSHPDDHRRTALGDRHRRDGSHDPAQRDRDERPGRGGGGRRQHAAPR